MSKLGQIGDILRYLAQDSHSIHYTGWVGYRNLGDEILLEAAQECFAPARIVWIREFHNARARALVARKRHELAMLGGGTQIGERSPIDRFRRAIAASKAAFVFGAGVTPAVDGPIPSWLEQWGEVLRPLAYVGVRGPESAATLRRAGVDAQVLGDPVAWFTRPVDLAPTKVPWSLTGLVTARFRSRRRRARRRIRMRLVTLAPLRLRLRRIRPRPTRTTRPRAWQARPPRSELRGCDSVFGG